MAVRAITVAGTANMGPTMPPMTPSSFRLPSESRCREAWTRIGPEHRARSCPGARRPDLAKLGVPAQGLGPTVIAWTTTGSPRSRRRSWPRSDRAAERRSGGRAGDQPPRRELPGGLPAHRSGAGAVRAGRGRRARGRVSSAAPAQTRRPLSLRRWGTRSPVRHGLSRRAGLVIETATFP